MHRAFQGLCVKSFRPQLGPLDFLCHSGPLLDCFASCKMASLVGTADSVPSSRSDCTNSIIIITSESHWDGEAERERERDGGCILGNESDGDSEEAWLRRFGVEENKAHHHPQSQCQEASPPRLAGPFSLARLLTSDSYIYFACGFLFTILHFRIHLSLKMPVTYLLNTKPLSPRVLDQWLFIFHTNLCLSFCLLV